MHIDKDGSAWNSSSLTMKNQGMKTGVVYQHPIGYLMIGHVTQDLQPDGTRVLGGTASFAGSMALALGLRVGIVISAGPEADLSALDGTAVVCPAQVGPPQVGPAQVSPAQVAASCAGVTGH